MAKTRVSATDTTNFSAIDYDTSASYNDVSLFTNTYAVPSADTTTETEYQMDWQQWHGYLNAVPELGSIIDRKAMWTVGKGFTADKKTKAILEKIRGNGKQTFNTILHNAVKVYTTGGDFYAEIIKDKRGVLRNLKPLNPGSIKIIANDKGIIIKYEQFTTSSTKAVNKFKPKDIFHLSWNPIADSIHGTPTVKKLKDVVEMFQEAKKDLRVVFHRYVKSFLIIGVDTDDETEIAAFKVKVDQTMEKAENLIVPKDIVDRIDKISIPQFSTLDPLPWIKLLETAFIKAEGVPDIVLGSGSDVTEASAKILYLAFQQMTEWNQLFLEEQILAQLGLKIELEFPASIAPDLISDDKKDTSLKSEGVNPTKDQK